MLELLDAIIDVFEAIYCAYKRLGARKLTIGCFVMVLILVALIGVIYSVRSVNGHDF